MVRSQPFSSGVPLTPPTSHGTATTSTNVSASSLRQTNDVHSGRSCDAEPADQQPLHRGRERRTRPCPAASSTRPLSRAATRPSSWLLDRHRARPGRRPAARPSTSPGRSGTARSPTGPTSAAAGGSKVRVESAACDGPAQRHRRRAEPGRALLGPARRRGQHADQALLGHRVAGRGHPGVAEERLLADARPARCAASRRPARSWRPGCRRRGTRRRRRWSSSARASTVDASTSRPTFAPSSRSQTGVNRLAYIGNSPARARSIRRSVAQTCQARRLCTGWTPCGMPIAEQADQDQDQRGRTRRSRRRSRAARRPALAW